MLSKGGLDFEPERELKLEDTGTRFKHYSDLLDIWGEGLRILRSVNPEFLSTEDKQQIAELFYSIKLLERQMEVMADYELKRGDLRREINNIKIQ